jgi:hypothetical protein
MVLGRFISRSMFLFTGDESSQRYLLPIKAGLMHIENKIRWIFAFL